MTCLKGLAVPGSLAGFSQVSSHPTLTLLFPATLQSGEASLFEVNIRYIGGLLSAFYLTGEEVSWPCEDPEPFRCEAATPLPHFTSEEQGFKGICSRATHVHPASTVPPAGSSSSSVCCFHSAAQVSPTGSHSW